MAYSLYHGDVRLSPGDCGSKHKRISDFLTGRVDNNRKKKITSNLLKSVRLKVLGFVLKAIKCRCCEHLETRFCQNQVMLFNVDLMELYMMLKTKTVKLVCKQVPSQKVVVTFATT